MTRVEELEAQLLRLQQAISASGLTGDLLVSLAKAHRQDSEIVDRVLAEYEALEQVNTALRQYVNHIEDCAVVRWMDRGSIMRTKCPDCTCGLSSLLDLSVTREE